MPPDVRAAKEAAECDALLPPARVHADDHAEEEEGEMYPSGASSPVGSEPWLEEHFGRGGSLQSAVEWCILHGKWTLALMLASGVGREQYQRVQSLFARRFLGAGSSLHAVLGMATGDAELAVAGGGSASIRWWRRRAATLLLHRRQGDSVVIARLGDRIWEEAGEVAGAHALYLIAGGWLEPSASKSRIVLAGGDHKRCP